MLNKNDPRLLEVMLTGIYNMLENHDTEDFMIAIMIEECGGMKRIDELQSHESFSVYKSAYEILDRFYSE